MYLDAVRLLLRQYELRAKEQVADMCYQNDDNKVGHHDLSYHRLGTMIPSSSRGLPQRPKPLYDSIPFQKLLLLCQQAHPRRRQFRRSPHIRSIEDHGRPFRLGTKKRWRGVLIFAPKSIPYPVSFLGIVAIGAIATTANPLYTTTELSKQIKDTRAKLIITIF
ncbi:hypothetical protein NE237_027039 [Protea cynaroides]|uniref:AMP-dependent synthetase/ligase domain-containing protein n=1 Tax=Protea cynaroides TaxID=273540 RepID=A0A9Q0JST7_9MAGN|nr:hypothetical protein NE237_027039 [Protea cynaroides]